MNENTISQMIYSKDKTECIDKQVCLDCGGDASEFKNDKSFKEYHISGLCQKCQDEVFGESF